MRVVVVGASGMLGTEVCKALTERNITWQAVSVNSSNQWIEDLIYLDGDENVLINCAGVLTNGNPREQINANGILPFRLRDLFAGKIIHVSTDCVYSGQLSTQFKSSIRDVPDPVSTYGVSKRMGELALEPDDLLVRTSFIGLRHGLLKWAIDHKDQKVEGWRRALWTGSTASVVAENLVDLMLNEVSGICHLSSSHVWTKYDLLNLISNTFHLNLQVESLYQPSINRALLPTHEITIPLSKALEDLYNEYITSDTSRSVRS